MNTQYHKSAAYDIWSQVVFNLINNVVEVVCMMAFDCHFILVLKVHLLWGRNFNPRENDLH